MVGAVAGTPGTNPTGWSFATAQSNGLTISIAGTGVENGTNYIDYRFNGTTVASPNACSFGFANATAATAQTWATSIYWKLASGTTTGVINWQLGIIESTAVGGFITGAFYNQTAPTSAALITQRPAATRTLSGGVTVGLVSHTMSITVAGNTAIDFTIRLGMPQLEQGAFATSVIPTTTAAATRSADVASITGANFSSWYRQDEGTVFASSTLISSSYANGVLWDVGAGGAFGTTAYGAWSGTQWTLNPNSAPVNMFSAVTAPIQSASAYALKANDSNIAAAGLTGTLDAACAMPASATTLSIGKAGWTAGNYLNGTIKRLTYWPQRLPNSALQAITQ